MENLKDGIIRYLSNRNLDEPYVVRKNIQYNRREVIEAIENDDELGISIISNLIVLALDLFDRDKENVEDFNRVK